MKTFSYNTDIYKRSSGTATIEAKDDSRFVIIVNADNGEKIVKPYPSRDQASDGVRYYLKKFDKLDVGASGTWYRLEEVK